MIVGRTEIRLEQRAVVPRRSAVVAPVLSVLVALVIGGIFLAATGHPPLAVYRELGKAGYGTWYGFTDTLAQATPIILTGLAAAFAFRMGLYNIGGEGQLYLGAIGAAWAGIAVAPHVPGPVAVLAVLLAGAAAGALWIVVPALGRAYLGASEIVTTLALNYVALFLMRYLIFDSSSFWRDPTSKSFPQGKPIDRVAEFPMLHFPRSFAGLTFPAGVTRVHLGLLVALLAAGLLLLIITRTGFGFDMKVVGDSPAAARYAGIPVRRTAIVVLLASGALAGLAGASEVGGSGHALDPNGLALGLGYTGIVVAALARYNPIGTVITAILLAGLRIGADSLQAASGSLRVPVAIALTLEGLILLVALGGEVFRRNRLVVRRVSEAQGAAAVVAEATP